MAKRPLFIDCDPGIDDLQAIMMAKGSDQFDIVGIAAVAGNVSLKETGRNAYYIKELLGIDCPVALGADKPMVFEMPRESVHGAGGLGGIDVPEPSGAFAEELGWELLWRCAREYEGKLEIFAIGPLTNIAIAVLKYPQITDYVKRIVIMGGAARSGNVTPYAEFNCYQDPFAMSVVLEAGFRNLTIVDLDACNSAYLTDAEADDLINIPEFGPILDTVIRFRRKGKRANIDKMTEEQKARVLDRNVACDAAAAAVLITPSVAEIDPYFIICETQSGLNYGQTIVDWTNRFNKHPNANLVLRIDKDKYYQLYTACMNNLSERSDWQDE